jgi:sec-independent protein translocase protein TatA
MSSVPRGLSPAAGQVDRIRTRRVLNMVPIPHHIQHAREKNRWTFPEMGDGFSHRYTTRSAGSPTRPNPGRAAICRGATRSAGRTPPTEPFPKFGQLEAPPDSDPAKLWSVIGDILQPTHLLFVLVIALLVLGPKRLPEVGRSLGRGIRDFRQAMSGEDHDEVEAAMTQTSVESTQPASEPVEHTTTGAGHTS